MQRENHKQTLTTCICSIMTIIPMLKQFEIEMLLITLTYINHIILA
jgi:hypothetical protein